MLRNIAYSILLALFVLLSGCKFTVHVGDGGDVDSLSGNRDCSEGQNCVFTVSDFTFDEVFTAVPYAGHGFVQWQAGSSPGENFLCGGSTNPNCTVSNVGLGGDALAQQIVASNETYRIGAVFRPATGFLGPSSQTVGDNSLPAATAECIADYGQGVRVCDTKEFFESSTVGLAASAMFARPHIIAVGPGTETVRTDFSGYATGDRVRYPLVLILNGSTVTSSNGTRQVACCR